MNGVWCFITVTYTLEETQAVLLFKVFTAEPGLILQGAESKMGRLTVQRFLGKAPVRGWNKEETRQSERVIRLWHECLTLSEGQKEMVWWKCPRKPCRLQKDQQSLGCSLCWSHIPGVPTRKGSGLGVACGHLAFLWTSGFANSTAEPSWSSFL